MKYPSLTPFAATGLDFGKARFDFHWLERTSPP